MVKPTKPLDERICACGCNETFKVRSCVKKRFIYGHYARVQVQKGFTKEEFYGKKRADEIKKKSSLKQKSIPLAKRVGEKKAKEMIESRIQKILGYKHTEKTKQKMSKSHKGKIYSEYTKQKISESLKGRILSEERRLKGTKWTKEKLIETYLELSPCTKNSLRGKHFGHHAVTKHWKSFDDMADKLGIPFKKIDNKIFGHNGRVGKNETQILDMIEKENNIKLQRQYVTARKFIDGYDPINNVAYEVDEKYHNCRKTEDIVRENKIKDKIGCEFVRINEQQFLNNINQKTLGDY